MQLQQSPPRSGRFREGSALDAATPAADAAQCAAAARCHIITSPAAACDPEPPLLPAQQQEHQRDGGGHHAPLQEQVCDDCHVQAAEEAAHAWQQPGSEHDWGGLTQAQDQDVHNQGKLRTRQAWHEHRAGEEVNIGHAEESMHMPGPAGWQMHRLYVSLVCVRGAVLLYIRVLVRCKAPTSTTDGSDLRTLTA